MTPCSREVSMSASAMHFLFPFCMFFLCDSVHSLGDVIYAINAGGEEHVDVHGIRYRRDPLFGKVGTASDYGKLLVIGRSPKSDHILYQTERYHTATFGYDIPVNKDGDYVLVLKFSEVYFDSPGRKVSTRDSPRGIHLTSSRVVQMQPKQPLGYRLLLNIWR